MGLSIILLETIELDGVYTFRLLLDLCILGFDFIPGSKLVPLFSTHS